MLRQTEEDADQEILQLKNKYEWQLRKRQEECTKLKGELGLQTKKASWKHVSVYKTSPPLSFISPPSLPPHITGDQSTGGDPPVEGEDPAGQGRGEEEEHGH